MLRLEFKVSRLELSVLAGCHLLAQLALLQAPMPGAITLVLSLLLGMNSWQLAQGALLRARFSVMALELGGQGQTKLWTRAGLFEGQLVAQPFAGRWLTVLGFRASDSQSVKVDSGAPGGVALRYFAVRVTADGVPLQQRKRLAAFLRYYVCPPPG